MGAAATLTRLPLLLSLSGANAKSEREGSTTTCWGVRRRLLGVGVCARRRALLLRADGARLRDTLLLCWPDGPRGRFRVEDVTRTSAEATPPPSGCCYNEPPRRGVSAPAPAPPPRKRRGVFPAEGGWSPRHQGRPKGWQHSARGQEHLGPWRFGAVDGARAGWRRAAFEARAALTLSAPFPARSGSGLPSGREVGARGSARLCAPLWPRL